MWDLGSTAYDNFMPASTPAAQAFLRNRAAAHPPRKAARTKTTHASRHHPLRDIVPLYYTSDEEDDGTASTDEASTVSLPCMDDTPREGAQQVDSGRKVGSTPSVQQQRHPSSPQQLMNLDCVPVETEPSSEVLPGSTLLRSMRRHWQILHHRRQHTQQEDREQYNAAFCSVSAAGPAAAGGPLYMVAVKEGGVVQLQGDHPPAVRDYLLQLARQYQQEGPKPDGSGAKFRAREVQQHHHHHHHHNHHNHHEQHHEQHEHQREQQQAEAQCKQQHGVTLQLQASADGSVQLHITTNDLQEYTAMEDIADAHHTAISMQQQGSGHEGTAPLPPGLPGLRPVASMHSIGSSLSPAALLKGRPQPAAAAELLALPSSDAVLSRQQTVAEGPAASATTAAAAAAQQQDTAGTASPPQPHQQQQGSHAAGALPAVATSPPRPCSAAVAAAAGLHCSPSTARAAAAAAAVHHAAPLPPATPALVGIPVGIPVGMQNSMQARTSRPVHVCKQDPSNQLTAGLEALLHLAHNSSGEYRDGSTGCARARPIDPVVLGNSVFKARPRVLLLQRQRQAELAAQLAAEAEAASLATAAALLSYSMASPALPPGSSCAAAGAGGSSAGGRPPAASSGHQPGQQAVQQQGKQRKRARSSSPSTAGAASRRAASKERGSVGATSAGAARTSAGLRGAVAAAKALEGRFVLRRSAIAQQGVFTTAAIPPGQLLLEYCGELIRHRVADVREARYQGRGLGCYFFAVDRQCVVDGTLAGNLTRYVNHSCDPNCEMVMRLVGGRRRLFLFSRRRLAPGEELSYDYKLTAPEAAGCVVVGQQGGGQRAGVMVGHGGRAAGDTVRCGCGAPHCRGFL